MLPRVSSCVHLESVSLQSPSRAVFIHSPLGLSIMHSTGVTSLISVSCQQPDLGVHFYPWSKFLFWRQPHYHIQWIRLQRWGNLRVNPGFRVFWFIPPLLAVAYLQSTSFIGRIFFWSFLSRCDLVSDRMVSFGLTTRRC